MFSSTVLSAIALAVTTVVAQTPAGFTPSTNVTLGVSFNTTNVVPGVLLPVAGKSI